MRGLIKPNAPYKQHFHAGIRFTLPGREFVVDPTAKKDVDEPGKPLVLTQATYDALRPKFGGPIVCEPVGGLVGEDAAKRIADLETQVADLTAQLAAKSKK